MSAFYDYLEITLGDEDALTDIRTVVRKLWFYDFVDAPVRLWDGRGSLFTVDPADPDGDSLEWFGTVDPSGANQHITPNVQDGRDGSSATLTMSMTAPTLELYEKIKAEKTKAVGRRVMIYMAIFKEGEELRPSTPIQFIKELTMFGPKFSEKAAFDNAGVLIKDYRISISAKDGNFGRANTPNRSYADTMQKEHALQNGVTLDRGCEHLARLANRVYQVP